MIEDPLDPNVGIDHHGKMYRRRGDDWVLIQTIDLCDDSKPVNPKTIEW